MLTECVSALKGRMAEQNRNKWRDRRTRQLKENLSRYGDYRDLMAAEFQVRRSIAPYYSLRDFARDLRMSPAQLSRVLKKQRGLSRKSAMIVSAEMGLTGLERRYGLLVQVGQHAAD